MSDSDQENRDRFAGDAGEGQEDPISVFGKNHYDHGQDNPNFKKPPTTLLQWIIIIWQDPVQSTVVKCLQIIGILIGTIFIVAIPFLISNLIDQDEINIEGSKSSQTFIFTHPRNLSIDSSQAFVSMTVNASDIPAEGYIESEMEINRSEFWELLDSPFHAR